MRRHPSSADGREALSDIARQQLLSHGVIFGVFIVLLAVSLAASWGAIRIVDSTRAYVTGESRYSKAEKIAVISLRRYAYSMRPEEYDRFLEATAIPLGDHAARVAMESSPPDFDAARQGFLVGENHPDDIAGMIGLFRWFSWWQPFAAAVADWRAGDKLVYGLRAEGSRLHALIASGKSDARARAELLDRVDDIDSRLTVLENTFSAHLGVAARSATLLVVISLSGMTILLWAMGTALAARLMRRQLALGKELQASQRRFRDFADVASDWYWEMDPAGRVTYVSERFGKMIGVRTSSVIDMDGASFMRDHSVTYEHRTAYLRAVEGRYEFRGHQVEVRDREGRARFLSVSAKPNLDANGEFVGYRGVGSDITEAIRDEHALREAKERAEVANRSKSEFLANMSHELRTPLNAILGFSDIIADQYLGANATERYRDYARDIHKSGEHLLSIIDDVLDLARIEAGRTQLVEQDVEIDSVVELIDRLLARRFLDNGVEFVVEVPIPTPVVRVDERKFTQIFTNLLSNAVKFTPRGGTVSFEVVSRSDGGLDFIVRDTGIGIAESHIQTVLAPFGQVESAFSRNHHGTGLGLPLAKSFAELHGGTLQLESTQGEGTTVTISLPRERVMEDAEKADVRTVASSA